MTNLYIFWKESSDPPVPWTRLTSANKYLRCSSSTANHWTNVGSTTHTHTVSGYSCGNSTPTALTENYMSGYISHAVHTHTEPASWTIGSANNTPPGYGLDIIYMDLAQWELYERRFPDGSVLLSNGSLVDSGYLSRFTSADGYYIYNTTPGTTTGSTSTHTHSVSGTTGLDASTSGRFSGLDVEVNASHSHTVSLTSSSTYPQPVSVVTRLYEVLAQTSKAISGTVVLVDDTPTVNFTILSAWNGANIKSGNSDPVVSGSDTHTQTFSGSSSTYGTNNVASYEGGTWWTITAPHSHTISGNLVAASHVPASKYVVPAVLNTTLYHPAISGLPQLVGLSAW